MKGKVKEIELFIEETFNVLSDLTKDKQFVFVFDRHHINSREIRMSKKGIKFSFTTSSQIIKGVQTHKELEFSREEEYLLEGDTKSIFVRGKDIFINNISYSEDGLKILSGIIHSFSTVKKENKTEKLFRRQILPVNSEELKLTDFQGVSHKIISNSTNKEAFSFHIPIKVNKKLFLLYQYKYLNNNYISIDCKNVIEEKEFQKICFNILLGMAFLKGNLYHNEAFLFGYEMEEMKNPLETSYYSMGGSIMTNMPTFTTNIHSIYKEEFDNTQNDVEYEELRKELYKDIYYFSNVCFSNLIELISNEEKIQRAIILYLHGHTSSLEIRLPNYFVAIEAITSYVSKLNMESKKRLNPIKDNKVANEVIASIKQNLKKFVETKNLTSEEFDLNILEKKLNSLNSPPNADKLAESFTLLGFTLSKEQQKILKKRNSYLHGSFVKYIDDDDAFSEVLYIALRVHLLVAILILKSVDFKGYVINYSSLWDYMSNKTIEEKKMVKI